MARAFKPRVVIFDVDGTLALRREGEGERGPFDWARVGEDLPNEPIVSLAQSVAAFQTVIVLSGREESCRKQTEMWLDVHRLNYRHLYMRASGDYRKDSVVKKEIYQKLIEPIYHVEYVVDDRDQVVNMWRNELGLTCLQVAEGDF